MKESVEHWREAIRIVCDAETANRIDVAVSKLVQLATAREQLRCDHAMIECEMPSISSMFSETSIFTPTKYLKCSKCGWLPRSP